MYVVLSILILFVIFNLALRVVVEWIRRVEDLDRRSFFGLLTHLAYAFMALGGTIYLQVLYLTDLTINVQTFYLYFVLWAAMFYLGWFAHIFKTLRSLSSA